MKTSDGGNNWFVIPPDSGIGFSTIYFIDSITGYGIGNYGIYKTTNGGLQWNLIKKIAFGGAYVFFYNASEGYATLSDSIYITNDSGINWKGKSIYSNITKSLYSVYFPVKDIGYGVGE